MALKLYVEPVMGDEINFVFHRCEVSFEVLGIIERKVLSNVRIAPPYTPDVSGSRLLEYAPFGSMKPDSITAAHTQSEMIFRGPGRGDLKGTIDLLNSNKNFDNSSTIIVVLAYSHEDQPIIIRKELIWSKPHPGENWILGRWISYS